MAKNDGRLNRSCAKVLSKEPIMTYAVPPLPWQIVASDCFECDSQLARYLVVVNLYSDFIKIRKLDTFQLKHVFTNHGVSSTLSGL